MTLLLLPTFMLVMVTKTLMVILGVTTMLTRVRGELCGDNREHHEGANLSFPTS